MDDWFVLYMGNESVESRDWSDWLLRNSLEERELLSAEDDENGEKADEDEDSACTFNDCFFLSLRSWSLEDFFDFFEPCKNTWMKWLIDQINFYMSK